MGLEVAPQPGAHDIGCGGDALAHEHCVAPEMAVMVVGTFLPLLALEYAPEGHAEAGVAQCVEHRVHRAVHVAEAVGEGEEEFGHRGREENLPGDNHDVRRPGDDEGEEDGQKGLGCFGLLFSLVLAAFLFRFAQLEDLQGDF